MQRRQRRVNDRTDGRVVGFGAGDALKTADEPRPPSALQPLTNTQHGDVNLTLSPRGIRHPARPAAGAVVAAPWHAAGEMRDVR